MPPYVYYDRRSVAATEVQFFHESRAKAANKELDTNMPKDLQFDVAFTIKKIVIVPEFQVISSATARDTGKLEEWATFLKTGVIEIQVAAGEIMYFPAALAVSGIGASGFGHYTLATAADGTLSVASIAGINGAFGLDVEISWPAGEELKFYIKTISTPAINPVTVYLIGEHP